MHLFSGGFKGINNEVLANYWGDRVVRLNFHAGRWNESEDIVGIRANSNILKTKGGYTFVISDIPTDQLDQITGIEAKVIVEHK
jgi:hypothetical protein